MFGELWLILADLREVPLNTVTYFNWLDDELRLKPPIVIGGSTMGLMKPKCPELCKKRTKKKKRNMASSIQKRRTNFVWSGQTDQQIKT